MPHILTSNHKTISTPCQLDGVDFLFVATSCKEDKVLVQADNKKFFLTIKNSKDNTLIKIDNTTRVFPISTVKKAINAYGKISNAQILFTNTNNVSTKVEPKKDFFKDIEYFVHDFKETRDILIEVGFGSGRHLIHQALKHPDKLIIGLEIHTPSIEQMLKQVNIQGIKNIIAVNYDARLFLEFMKSNSIETIFVHFPVPWDKKPHRRVMSIEFIKQSLRALKIDGTLELRTDSPNYFEYSQELLNNFTKYPSKIIKNKDLDVVSKYETRWKKQGKDIWDVIITSTLNDNEVVIDDDFLFTECVNTQTLNLEKKPIVKKDYLVHFENIFSINENDKLIHITMGSFNKPVSKFILIENNIASYFQGAPIPTSANIMSHTLIKELLK